MRETRPIVSICAPSAPFPSELRVACTQLNELGLYHTGTGATSAPGGNTGPSCDTVISEVPSERNIFTLNSAIAGVSEGNFGRLGANQQGVYVNGNARRQLDPKLWEMPGAMPEIVPGGDFGANIDRLFTERSMVMQAWGAYGVLWPVIHQSLGVSPELGRGRVAVVPQLPAGQSKASADTVKLGPLAIDVAAEHQGSTYTTKVTRPRGSIDVRIGAVLPDGAKVASAKLNGSPAKLKLVKTTRGLEAVTKAKPGQRTSTLVITVAP